MSKGHRASGGSVDIEGQAMLQCHPHIHTTNLSTMTQPQRWRISNSSPQGDRERWQDTQEQVLSKGPKSARVLRQGWMRCCVSTEEANEVETSEHSLEGGLRVSGGGEELHFYSGNSMSKTKEVLKSPHGPGDIQRGKGLSSPGARGEVGWYTWPRLSVKVCWSQMLTEQGGDIISFTLC